MGNNNGLKIAIGPILYFIALSLPILGPMEARVGFGILFWIAYYWVSGAVPINYTILVPILGAILFPVLPLGKVVSAYVDKLILLIVATGFISAAWIRWGLARRLALNVLVFSGNNARNQVTIWFVLATLVSCLVADTITAVAFAPIAASVLMASGFDTVESRWNSLSASNLMIALAWGSSHGGFGTPLGGGQALVVYQLLGKEVGHNIAFIDWAMRAIPPTLFTAIFIVAFLRWGMKYDVQTFSGGRDVYREELKKLGPMNTGEWVSLIGFLVAIGIAFLEPFIKGLPFKIEPAAVFLLIAVIMFFIPANKEGEKVISEEMVKKHFPITAIVVWPTAVALAAILEMSGATKVMGSWLAPLATASPAIALAGFTGLAGLMTQFSTNTAANAVVVPMAVSTMKAVGQSPIPWAYSVGLMGSLGYAVVSASGGIAVVVAYGANIRRMFTNGLIAFAIAWVANWIFWYLVMFVFKFAFYFRT
ncbi:MAG: hypothetical protein VR68_04710 [Peptococcaceae bacterium BRH_c4a]|nr:MAG: hypothetical protein VR68_04710 [Peptococcaceae bacterium BRH_c4a]